MRRRHLWLATFGGLFVLLEVLAVVSGLRHRWAELESAATRAAAARAPKQPRFMSELSPEGLLKSTELPEPMHMAADMATGLFRNVRWEEFIVTANPPDNPRKWTVHIEPKSGERDDVVWVTIEGDRVTSYGFRRKNKLMGYAGKTMRGAEPGFCRSSCPN
jgi:hypothetical protein